MAPSYVSECVMFLISSKHSHLYQSDIVALGRKLIDNETTTSGIINLVYGWGRVEQVKIFLSVDETQPVLGYFF